MLQHALNNIRAMALRIRLIRVPKKMRRHTFFHMVIIPLRNARSNRSDLNRSDCFNEYPLKARERLALPELFEEGTLMKACPPTIS